MAPYAGAHLKLGLLLKEKGFDFPPGQRLGVFLTNTLEKAIKTSEVLYGPIGYITEESNTAAGLRGGKYEALAEMEVGTGPWQELQPAPPFYLFMPQAIDLWAEYDRGWKLTEIFPVSSVGG